jgi:arylsulfatase A-like enzyme
MKTSILANVVIGAILLLAAPLRAATVVVDVGERGTQIEAGAFNTTKNGLNAENGTLWGVSNTEDKDGMLYFSYSELAGTTLPATIQAGSYTFSGRIGYDGIGSFVGLNEIDSGVNTARGAVAGFFSTLSADAQTAKNNMYTEFNGISGVSYIAPVEAAPGTDAWTTWTFIWEVEEGSPVIGTNPYFGVYVQTGSGGSAFWDDSTLYYTSSTAVMPEIYDFLTDISTIETNGTQVTLSWAVSTNLTQLSISPDVGDVLPATVNGIGQTSVIVNAQTTFTLTASNEVFAVSSNVVVRAPELLINDFSANTHLVDTNGTLVALSWDVFGAESVSIAPDIGEVSAMGQTSIVVHAAATYTLTASSGMETVSADWTFHLPQTQPNILLVLVDDYGVTDTSVPFAYDRYDETGSPIITGFNEFYHTPNMETLAERGMKFTQAYAMPMCSPTRTSLMTGFNSPRHGITAHLNVYNTIDNAAFNVPSHRGPNNWRYHGMDASDVTLPQLLGAEGYRTIHCGKAHFGCDGEYADDPEAIGFDINIAGTYRGQPASYVGDYGDDLPGLDAYENTGTFLTDALTQEMNATIEQAVADGVPFFGYMAYYAVHSPFTTNPDATNDYSAAVSTNHEKFGTMVEGVDISIGDILAKLDELGVAEDTLIVFLGDNGSDSPALTDEGYAIGSDFDDFPIRGKKASAYEGGCRVPLIISWAAPSSGNIFQQTLPIAGGSVEHDLVSVEDIVPTILKTAGASVPDMDGYDLSPYLRSETGTHRPQKILRHMPHEHRSDYFLWFREGDWKILYRFHTDAFELYNLTEDPDESTDLSSAQPEKVLTMARAMARELDDAWGEYGALWPTLNPTQVKTPDRPLEDDPFYIDFSTDGRDAIDSDGDGLTDAEEDPDADGLVDETETDPDDADTDGDGTNDHAELRLNLDPRNADEAFRVQIEGVGADSVALRWPSAAGLGFNVVSATNLTDTPVVWTVVSNIQSGVTNELTQYVASTNRVKYFMVDLLD